MNRTFLIWGAFAAGLAVALGAFGAHGLEEKITADSLANWKTGVTYQFYHSFALLLLSVLAPKLPGKRWRIIGWLFGLGILFFSGSLYLLSTREITGLSAGFLGPLTPLGGLLLIGGWALLMYAGIQQGKNKAN